MSGRDRDAGARGEPVDAAAVLADDEALDRLVDALSWGDDEEGEPAPPDVALRLLDALRRDVVDPLPGWADPLPAGADPAPAPRPSGTLRLRRRAVTVAVTIGAVVSFGGVAAAAVTARQGSPWYGVRDAVAKVVAPPDLGRVHAATRLLDRAEHALDEGRNSAAGALLRDAQRLLDAAPDSAPAAAARDRLAALRARLALLLTEPADTRLARPGPSGSAGAPGFHDHLDESRTRPGPPAHRGEGRDRDDRGRGHVPDHSSAGGVDDGMPARAPSGRSVGRSQPGGSQSESSSAPSRTASEKPRA